MNDTHPEAERVQIEIMRKMSVQRRAALASLLRNRTYALARRAIALARPELSPLEQKLLFIEVSYGKELAANVRRFWMARNQQHA